MTPARAAHRRPFSVIAVAIAALLLAAAPSRRAAAAPDFGTLSMAKCRGATTVSEDNPTIYTTAPDSWSITVSSTTADLACPAALPTPQLITNTQALWHLNNSLNDSAANGNTLTSTNYNIYPSQCTGYCTYNSCQSPTFNSSGKFSQARSYPAVYSDTTCQDSGNITVAGSWYSFGVDQRTSTPLQNTFQEGSWSVEAWVKSPGPPFNRTSGGEAPVLIVGQVDTAGNGCNDNKCVFLGFTQKYLRVDFGNHATVGKTLVNDANWHHVAFVYDRSSNAQYVYLDGNLDNNSSSPTGSAKDSPLATTGLSSTFNVGSGTALWPPNSGINGDGNAFGGSIDELRIVNYALSAQEIAAHWTGQGYAKNGPYTGAGSCGASYTYNQGNLPLGTLTSGATVVFFAEDTAEDAGHKEITLTIDQADLAAPVLDSSSVTAVSNNSITWSWGANYVCNSPTRTTYEVQLINNGTAGAWSTPQAATTYSASSLSPNSVYGLSVRATYTDTGGSGQINGPSSASLEVDATTYANVPGTPTAALASGTTVTLTIDKNSNPDGTGGTNATQYLVQASRNGGDYTTISNWSTSVSRSLTSLTKSSNYYFRVKARNANDVETSTGPNSTPRSVTQPNAPTGFSGTPYTAGCPKTQIQWTWNAATVGGTFQDYQFENDSDFSSPAGVATNSSLESGLSPGTAYARYVRVRDSEAASYPSAADSASATTSPADVDTPGAPSGTPASPTSITWTWTPAGNACSPTYKVYDAAGAPLAGGANVASPWTPTGLSANTLYSAKVDADDAYDADRSAKSGAGWAYTHANDPTALTLTGVTTGSVTLGWTSANPAYTRFVVTYSADAFATTTSTRVFLSDDFTGTSVGIGGLQPGTLYSFRVQAFNGRSSDFFGGVGAAKVSASAWTLPLAPVVSGAASSSTQIVWSWSAVAGAAGYRLYTAGGSTLLSDTAGLSYSQTGLGINSEHGAEIEAYNASGTGLRSAPAYLFTHAVDPVSPVITAVSSNSVSYSWGDNGNPGYTYYEVDVAADPLFAAGARTLTVNAPAATATGLFPDTPYYARLRSISGSQAAGNYVAIAPTSTLNDPSITSNPAAPSAYIPPSGTVGQWQFDESTGVVAADTSGLGNTAYLTCAAATCASTPTFVAGPSGLGSAVAFSGLNHGLVRVPDTGSYAFTDNLTVSAWVKPSASAQPDGAGLVVRGNGGAENFALDVSGGLYRFAPKPGFVVSSTNSISAGTWTHLIAVYDSAALTATLYVDGRPAATIAGVPARTAAAHDISIGNRQSGSTTYDRGFLGSIDSVRVQNRALNAAEALAEYQGSFVSTITPLSPNSSVLIGLAPNAFGAPATLFVSLDPVLHPIKITPAAINTGLTVIPTGFTLVPNSFVEIVPVVGGVPFTQTLGSSASVSIPYADADGNNMVDDTSPPLTASKITMHTLNTTVNRWEALPTFVDPASRRVTFLTPHFSVFAMFAPLTVGTALSQVRVYPVPWRPGSRSRFDAAAVTFDRLPLSGAIRILNLAGERVREFSFDGAAAGSAAWNGLTDGGRRAASGVYFARITSDDGSASVVKFAIER